MVAAWRIVQKAFAPAAFDGESARLYGGRWNSPGKAVVYAAQTGALAALEMLVHLERSELLLTYALIRCSFEAASVIPIDRGLLPANWRTSPAPAELRRLGDEWIRDRVSVVLEVPSVVLGSESNYLLNPAHPDFHLVQSEAPIPFTFDERLR